VSKTRLAVLFAIALLSAQVAVRASGTPATDWYLGSSGTYSWAGGSSALMGANLGIQDVVGNGTPLFNGQAFSITDGLMNFTSGAYNGVAGSTWSWGPGGTFNVMGCIAGVTATSCTGSNNVVLLSDDFQSITIVPIGGSNFDIEFGQISGTINAAVASHFGLSSTSFAMSNFVTVSDTTAKAGTAFTGNNLGGMIDAVDPVATAENWGLSDSLALFALALLAFGVLTRLGVLRTVYS